MVTQSDPPTNLLSLKASREILGVSQPTLKRMLRDGLIPVVEVSARRRLIDPEDLRAFIVSRKRTRSRNDDDPAVTGSLVQASAGSGSGDEQG